MGRAAQLLVDLFMQDLSAAERLIFACFAAFLCGSGWCIDTFPFNQDLIVGCAYKKALWVATATKEPSKRGPPVRKWPIFIDCVRGRRGYSVDTVDNSATYPHSAVDNSAQTV